MQQKRTTISFIGIGAATAAPLLYTYIKTHPELFIPDRPATFFSDDAVRALGIDAYEAAYQGHKEGQVCGELSLTYLHHPAAAEHIARIYPQALLLAVLENPLVSVRVSFVEARRAGTVAPHVTLESYLEQHPEVLAAAKYGRALSTYFSLYSGKDLMVVMAKEVRDEPLKTISRVFKHLGVNKEFVPLMLAHLVPIDEDEIKRQGKIKRAYKAIAGGIKKVYTAVHTRLFPQEVVLETASTEARAMPLDPKTEHALQKYFYNDVDLLGKLVHRDFIAEWDFPTR